MTVGFLGGKFLPLHQGHVYAITTAAKQVDELYVILSSSQKRDKQLCDRDGIKEMPAQTRLGWLGETLTTNENIHLLHIEDDHGDEDYDWAQGAAMITRAIGKPIDVVFSSEPAYDEQFRTHYPASRHVIIDAGREAVPISATQLRQDLYRHWDKLPASVRPFFTKRVLVTGTESVGKSTLVKKLAAYYNTAYVHEVGRDYCARYKNQLAPELFERIAMEHALLQEERAKESNKVLLVDSDAVVTQYYLGMYSSGAHSTLIDAIASRQRYDLVLYLEPDVPWVADGLRFAGDPTQRARNNERLKRLYAERHIPLTCISGEYASRFARATQAIDALFVPKKRAYCASSLGAFIVPRHVCAPQRHSCASSSSATRW